MYYYNLKTGDYARILKDLETSIERNHIAVEVEDILKLLCKHECTPITRDFAQLIDDGVLEVISGEYDKGNFRDKYDNEKRFDIEGYLIKTPSPDFCEKQEYQYWMKPTDIQKIMHYTNFIVLFNKDLDLYIAIPNDYESHLKNVKAFKADFINFCQKMENFDGTFSDVFDKLKSMKVFDDDAVEFLEGFKDYQDEDVAELTADDILDEWSEISYDKFRVEYKDDFGFTGDDEEDFRIIESLGCNVEDSFSGKIYCCYRTVLIKKY